jgi:hypothetical protein
MIDPTEAEHAQQLIDDPRTNDQLVFDLLMATLKAGAEADPSTGFGTRQPGVRIVITQEQLNTRDDNGHLTGTGFNEDTGEAIPGPTIERHICTNGTRTITVDHNNNPLDVGREQRCFTTKQRIGLAIRDGGCVFEDCDKPPSMTEAHHINEWATNNGLTNIADGVLVCREDHMLIHNNGWKIIRQGHKYYSIPPTTIDPDQKPRPLRIKSTLKQPPPKTHQQHPADAVPTAPEAPPPSAGAPTESAGIPAPPRKASSPPRRQAPGAPSGPQAPTGSSRPANRKQPTPPGPINRRQEPNVRAMESWYVPEEPEK